MVCRHTRPFSAAKGEAPGRLSGLPIGVAGTRGEKNGTAANPQVPTYRTAGLNTFFSYTSDTSATAAPGSTTVAAGVQNRLTGHVYAPVGPLAVLGEYMISQQRVARGAKSALLTNQAWGVTAAVELTGEDARFDGVTPKHPIDFSKGYVGAVELVLRYGALMIDRDAFDDFASDTKSARFASEYGGGLNWYAIKNYKVMADYFVTEFRSGAAAAAGGRRDLEQVFLLRNQVAFSAGAF